MFYFSFFYSVLPVNKLCNNIKKAHSLPKIKKYKFWQNG